MYAYRKRHSVSILVPGQHDSGIGDHTIGGTELDGSTLESGRAAGWDITWVKKIIAVER